MLIQMLENKDVIQDSSFLCNQYDNESASIAVNLPALFTNAEYNYFILCKAPNGEINQYSVPLVLSVDKLTFAVTSVISSLIGNWQFCIVIKSATGNLIAISAYWTGKVLSGIATQDELVQQAEDANLKLLYDASLQAETLRVIAEDDRLLSEIDRKISEDIRVAGEALRESAEVTRVAQESTRVTAETNREVGEASRALAETNRGVTFNQLVENGVIETAIEGKLTELETTYAPRLTTTEQQINSLEYQVNSEEQLRNCITQGYTSIALKKDIILTSPVNFDGLSIRLNLNGFKITLSDTYSADYIFSIGYLEDIETQTGVNRTAKNFFNGFIDCNDKDVHVFKYYFSWDFKCRDLRIERCGLGFIGYYDEVATLSSRGAECVLDNITIVGSEYHVGTNIGFDIWFGDAYCSNLYAQYFTKGVLNRTNGNTYEKCHVWGLPLGSSNNKKMAIGFENRGYYVNFISCIADTPELLDGLQPASLTNGGIGFYDAYSSEVRYIGCEILEHSASADGSLYGWYLANEGAVAEQYYGQSMYFSNCNTRNAVKLAKPIYYTGKRALTILGCNFDANSRVRETNYFNAATTFFKSSDYSDIDKDVVNEKNTFKFMFDDYRINIIGKNNDGINKFYRVRETLQNSYTITQLADLKTKLIAEATYDGSYDRTGPITVVLYSWDGTKDHFDLVVWIKSRQKFYYVKDGITEVTGI